MSLRKTSRNKPCISTLINNQESEQMEDEVDCDDECVYIKGVYIFASNNLYFKLDVEGWLIGISSKAEATKFDVLLIKSDGSIVFKIIDDGKWKNHCLSTYCGAIGAYLKKEDRGYYKLNAIEGSNSYTITSKKWRNTGHSLSFQYEDKYESYYFYIKNGQDLKIQFIK